jgi:hypothetical protein
MAEFTGSINPNHWAYRFVEQIVGTGHMKFRNLRQLAVELHKTFPEQAPKCERDLIRTWDGCIYYLVKYHGLVTEMCHTNPATTVAPGKVECSRPLLPSIQEVLARIPI